MGTETLHELAVGMSAGLVRPDAVFAALSGAVYCRPARFGFEDEDDAAEALSRYKERILALIARFEPRGVPFEAYMSASLRFLGRSRRRARRLEVERDMVRERVESFCAEERQEAFAEPGQEALSSGEPLPLFVRPRPRLGKRQLDPLALSPKSETALESRLVFLLLKCPVEAGKEDLERVAAASGLPPGRLAAALGLASRFMEPERAAIERTSAARDRSWARLCLLEIELAAEPEPERRRRLRESIERERERYERALARARRRRPVLSNAQVARILGVPKGTVDSGIHYLKRGAERGDLRVLAPDPGDPSGARKVLRVVGRPGGNPSHASAGSAAACGAAAKPAIVPHGPTDRDGQRPQARRALLALPRTSPLRPRRRGASGL